MRLAPIIGAAFPFLFPGVIAGVHIHHFLLEQTLDRVLDLNLVRPRIDPEDVLVLLLAQKSRFFRQGRSLNNFVRLVHEILSASFSSASCVTTIFSNVSNCSVFTSDAVANSTGFTLRADLRVFSSNESEISKTFCASVCFFSNATNDFVFSSGTTNLSMVRTSPALIRSLNAF